MGILTYDSNNSGGSWWLSDEDWNALERAGWTVHWIAKGKYGWGRPLGSYDSPLGDFPRPPEEANWLGAKACSAAKEFSDARAGIDEWERVTGACASDLGCSCCGAPHSFEFEDGDETKYIGPEWPETGELSGL